METFNALPDDLGNAYSPYFFYHLLRVILLLFLCGGRGFGGRWSLITFLIRTYLRIGTNSVSQLSVIQSVYKVEVSRLISKSLQM